MHIACFRFDVGAIGEKRVDHAEASIARRKVEGSLTILQWVGGRVGVFKGGGEGKELKIEAEVSGEQGRAEIILLLARWAWALPGVGVEGESGAMEM
jgi:hypothetical protein